MWRRLAGLAADSSGSPALTTRSLAMGLALHPRKSGGDPPKKPKISPPLRRIVLGGLLCRRLRGDEQVLEFFKTRVEAETMLKRVLVAEPDWREVLHVERVELVTGGLN